MSLHEHAQKREAERIRFEASLHGAKLKGRGRTITESDGGPSDGSPEQKEELTRKMIERHKRIVAEGFKGLIGEQ